jgi:hypothetical protein
LIVFAFVVRITQAPIKKSRFSANSPQTPDVYAAKKVRDL